MLDIELVQGNVSDPELLVPPTKRSVDPEQSVDVGNLRLRLGDRPVALDLR